MANLACRKAEAKPGVQEHGEAFEMTRNTRRIGSPIIGAIRLNSLHGSS